LRSLSARDYSFNLLLAVIIGIIGGYGAVGFRYAISGVQHLAYGIAEPGFSFILDLPWYLRLAIPVVGGLIVGPIVTFMASEAKGHGVPEVMASVATSGGIIRGRVAAAKVVASAVTIGSGGSAGSEGPIVQIGSAVASKLGQFLRVSPRRMKTFVGCGAAAGIAATFNAPVAGMLFAVEIILGDFGVAQLSPIIVSSVTATAISRAYLGSAPAFAVPAYELASPVELLYYVVLGVAAALVAVAFARSLTASESFFERLRVPDWLKPAIGGLVIGILGVVGMSHVFGVGYEFIEEALSGHLALSLLVFLILAKIIATSATLGSGGSGGILAPSLFIGAMTGGVVWYAASAISPDIVTSSYGAYALVGMAAVVASATRAPLQAILILFELTGGYEVILPLMLSSIIAVIVGHQLMEDSIYTVKLRAKGILLRRGTEINVLRGMRVQEVMSPEVFTVPHNMRLRPFLDLVAEIPVHSSIFVIDEEEQLIGNISYQEIRRVLSDIQALEPLLVVTDVANLDTRSVAPHDTLDVAMRMFEARNHEELPVIDPTCPGKVIGSLHRADVDEAYQNEIQRQDLLGSIETSNESLRQGRTVPFAPGYLMTELEVPSHYIGQDLRSLDLRNREKIEVMMIRRHNANEPHRPVSLMPSADLILEQGDRILISGPEEVIERLARS